MVKEVLAAAVTASEATMAVALAVTVTDLATVTSVANWQLLVVAMAMVAEVMDEVMVVKGGEEGCWRRNHASALSQPVSYTHRTLPTTPYVEVAGGGGAGERNEDG